MVPDKNGKYTNSIPLESISVIPSKKEPIEILPLRVTKIEIKVNYKVPSKKNGRKGTRKSWKRLNPPKTIIAQELNFLENLEYFKRKLYKHLMIPKYIRENGELICLHL